MLRTNDRPCVLCGNCRGDVLFVVGAARVAQCRECGLVARQDRAPDRRTFASYAMAPEVADSVLSELDRRSARRVLAITCGIADAVGLPPRPGFAVESLDLSAQPDPALALGEHPGGSPYDAVFVNGAIEHLDDPVEFLRRVRGLLRPGGVLAAVVADGSRIRDSVGPDQLPSRVFTPANLSRLALETGFRPERNGFVMQPAGRPIADVRLQAPRPFARLKRVLTALGFDVASSSGLLLLVARAAEPARPKVSVIMPVFNEAGTFPEIFKRVVDASWGEVDREIVIVESNSSDGSRALVEEASRRHPDIVRLILEDRPSGKGHAVRAGIARASGDVILIQDADLEYDVTDYDIVLDPLLRLNSTFVLGSRHLGARSWKIRRFKGGRLLSFVANLAHELFTWIFNRLYGLEVRDPMTMFKVFRRECVAGIEFRRDRFDFDFELICKLVRRGHEPLEVPINYRARSFDEGKKIRIFRDPPTWLKAIVACRFEAS